MFAQEMFDEPDQFPKTFVQYFHFGSVHAHVIFRHPLGLSHLWTARFATASILHQYWQAFSSGNGLSGPSEWCMAIP